MHDRTDPIADAHLNLRGLHCPAPIIHCRAALQRLAVGASLQVTTDNLDATRDLLLLINRGGARFLGWRHDANGFHFLIQKQPSCAGPKTKRSLFPHGWNRLRGWLGGPAAESC